MKENAVFPRPDRLTDSISRELRRMIEAEEIRPGGWLPPQPALARRFGVGLSTVREAIKGLALLGILEPQPGRGTQVSIEAVRLIQMYDIARTRLEGLDIAELLEARRPIEVTLTTLAAARATEDDIAAIEKELLGMQAVIQDERAFTQADLRFHLAVARAGKNRLLESFYTLAGELLSEAIMESFAVGPGSGRWDTVKDHEQVLASIRAHDSSAARQRAEAVFLYWDQFLKMTSGRKGLPAR